MGKSSGRRTPLLALVANRAGEIFELDGYGALGMANAVTEPLTRENTAALPFGSELMMLPRRIPIVQNLRTGQREVLSENPYAPGEPVFPVAAFNSPGFVARQAAAFQERDGAQMLPLFSYGAVGWSDGGFRSAALCVDREPRQDLRRMPREQVVAGVRRMRRRLPDNRLRLHLETCALTYGCPAGKNFFLGRYEAPLPTSRACNARCLGCISLQPEGGVSCSQERIGFTPSPEEIAQVALAHIGRVKRPVVSFGQGCEGDPLMAAEAIVPAIRLIRKTTSRGTINMNTNGSRPEVIAALIDAGLDSLRISMNSVREACYTAYFRPANYAFSDVMESIRIALSRNRFVAINYLNCPGFTDTPAEVAAFIDFRDRYPIHMIQWRNLNYDPLRYWAAMDAAQPLERPVGVASVLKQLRARFPELIYGYFNPPKERWRGLLGGDR